MSRQWCWIVVFIAVTLSQHAVAQAPVDPDAAAKNAARTLAQTGKTRLEAGDFAGALQAFDDAEKYFRAPTITRMRAFTLEKLGRLIEAQRAHREVADEKLPAGAPPEFVNAQEDSKKSVASLETRIPKIQIVVLHAPPGTRVSLDGSVVDAAALSAAIRVDPKKHTVLVEPPKGAKVTREVDVAEQASVKVEIDLAPPPPKPVITAAPTSVPLAPTVAPSATPAPSGTPDTPPVSKRSFLGPGIAFGVGGAGLIVGAITGGMAIARMGEITDLCGGDRVCPNGTQEKVNIEGVKGLGYVSTVGFVVAGVGAATGVVLWLLPIGGAAKGAARPATSLQIGPGSIGVKGAF